MDITTDLLAARPEIRSITRSFLEPRDERVEREHTFIVGEKVPATGNPTHRVKVKGMNPVDAIMRHWATCMPDSRLATEWHNEEDGYTYVTSLDADGKRTVTIKTEAVQFYTVPTV